MQDRNDVIRQIEERLGSEGNWDAAERCFDVLTAQGDRLTFDPGEGYTLHTMDEAEWQALLVAADA